MSEDTNLTLPGDIPKLLRRGSPVTHIDGSRLVVVELDGGDAKLPSGWAFTRLLTLDLSDATGRAHAAWWLAAKLFPNDGPYIAAAVLPGRTIGPTVFGLSLTSVMDGERWRRHGAFDCTDDLDLLNPRLLPDGSRWVDAEALRRVCLHVAGLPLT